MQILLLLLYSSFFLGWNFLSFFYIHKYVDIIVLNIFPVFANKSVIIFRINQEFANFDLYLQSFVYCWFLFKKVILNTSTSMLSQYLPNCTYILQSYLKHILFINSQQVIGTNWKIYKRVCYYFNIFRCPRISNWWTFGLSNRLDGRAAPATEFELNMFWYFPFKELVWHLSTQTGNRI